MTANDVKKDLYKSKNMAKFSHYVSGNLYYTVDLSFGRFQFLIPIVEMGQKEIIYKVDEKENKTFLIDVLKLSEDLGTTTFEKEMKGSDLNRWIAKAIDKGEFIKIHTGGLNLTKLDNDIDNMLESMSKEEIKEWLKSKM